MKLAQGERIDQIRVDGAATAEAVAAEHRPRETAGLVVRAIDRFIALLRTAPPQ